MMKVFTFLLLLLGTLVAFCRGYIRCSDTHRCLNGGVCRRFSARCECLKTFYGEQCEHKNLCHPTCPPNKVCVGKDNGTTCEEIQCSKVADIVCILDCSGSISKSEYKTMLDTIANFITQIDKTSDSIRVGVFAYNDFICKRIIHLNDYTDKTKFTAELMKYLDDHQGGGTRTDLALRYGRTQAFTEANGDRNFAPNTMLVITDGKSNKPDLTRREALKLKNTNISVIPIGIGDSINLQELKMIATRENDVILTNFKELPNLVDTLVYKTCDDSLDPCRKKPCKHNGICRPFLTEYMCDCPQPYVGINCEKKCNISGDIMIAIDESRSVTQENFNKIINAVMFFIKNLDISSGRVRVGIITFALDVFVHYDLDSFSDKLDMLFVCNLLRYQYKGGPTFTHKALEYLRRFSFTPERGDREEYPNYVLFFTDGNSYYPWLTRRSAKVLHRSGVSINAIGVGPNVGKHELKQIASQPKRNHVILTSFIRLELAMKTVLTQACEDLKPLEPCLECKSDCNCPQGMRCCNRCCRDTVTLLS